MKNWQIFILKQLSYPNDISPSQFDKSSVNGHFLRQKCPLTELLSNWIGGISMGHNNCLIMDISQFVMVVALVYVPLLLSLKAHFYNSF